MSGYAVVASSFLLAYLIGGVPWAYIIVKRVTGEDIAEHGTGNVGAMNVRRTTGSWGWFVAAMVADASKGMIAVGAAYTLSYACADCTDLMDALARQSAVVGAVLGHNYSIWLALLKRRYVRTGKGLATGGGALLVYNPLYFAIVLVTGLATIFITKYMMAGQVAASVVLPAYTLATRRPDWPFAVLLGAIVYAAHHKRFVGLLRGQEPRFYIHDRQGPKG